MTALTPARMAELRRLADEATGGEWRFEPEGDSECGEPGCCSDHWYNRVWADGVVIVESHHMSAADAAFIAAARSAVPALLDALARVEALADDLSDKIEELRADVPPSAGASRVAHIYRAAGLSDARDRLRSAIRGEGR